MIVAQRQVVLDIRSAEQANLARKTVQDWATRLGFSTLDKTKFVTAASELARNTFVHGGGGAMTICEVTKDGRLGIKLVFEDKGPGIPDIDKALTDGFSTAKSMGLGLGGARRLVQEFEINSKVNEGTKVSITQWKRR